MSKEKEKESTGEERRRDEMWPTADLFIHTLINARRCIVKFGETLSEKKRNSDKKKKV